MTYEMQAFELTEQLLDYYEQEYPNYEDIKISNVTRMTENWETIVYTYELNYIKGGDSFSKHMIIRLYPGKEGQQTAEKEFNLMASLMMTTVQIPDPYRFEKSSVVDLPFMIMEYINGDLLSSRMLEDQDRFDFYINHFARTLVDIHNVDWQTMIREFETYQIGDTPYQYLAQLLNSYKDKIELHDKKEFIPVLRWLVERMDTVPLNRLSLVHGDYHLANIMIDRDDEMYVIDWVDAVIGDFRVDVAWSLLVHETNLGKPIRDQIFNTYRSYAAYDVTNIKYFEVLAILRQLLDLSINFSYSSEIAKLNPSRIDDIMDNLEPIKKSLHILYGHTHIKLPEFKAML